MLMNDGNRSKTSISNFSLYSIHFKDELIGEAADENTSVDTNYDFDGNLDHEALWTEHNIHNTEKTRILKILHDCLNCISIALSLNILMEDENFLSSNLTEREFKKVKADFENCYKEVNQRRSVGFVQEKMVEYAHFCESINILCKKKEISSKARLIIRSQFGNYNIYNVFEKLFSFFTKILNTPIKTENNHDLFLVDIWNKNEKAKIKIQELQAILNQKQSENSKLIEEKNNYIHSHTEAATSLKFACIEQIKRGEKKVERRMINDVYESEELNNKLQEESKKLQNEYELLLGNNLRIEKDLRKMNLKIETQLYSWIEKYDLEMIERQDRYDELNKKFLDEKFLHDEIRAQLDMEQPIYDLLMAEKQEYLEKIWNEKYQHFVQNLAAKRIQRFYRQHRKNVLKKRKAAQTEAARGYKSGNKKSGWDTLSKSKKSSKSSKSNKSFKKKLNT